MIQWVYEGVSTLFEHLLVATDDRRIFDAVEGFGGLAQMTSPEHRSGTERCAEAATLHEQKTGRHFKFVVNIQGDEPLIKPEQLQALMDCIRMPGTGIATLIRPLVDKDELENPNSVKVVVDQSFQALYFSRAPIPFVRAHSGEPANTRKIYYSHIGLYAFRRQILDKLVQLPPTPLELAESLEQLRWLEHGHPIRTAVTLMESIGVDTPEDLEYIRKKGSF